MVRIKPYTVVLKRPTYQSRESETPNWCDTFTAMVDGKDKQEAVHNARRQVMRMDRKDGIEVGSEFDYGMILIFEGHHNPVAFGWQAGYNL